MTKGPNKITTHNAGWRSQFCFAVTGFWSGVAQFFGLDDSNIGHAQAL
jgi:hypothetical protein